MDKPVLKGHPVRSTFLPFNRPCIEDDDIAAVTGSLARNSLSMSETVLNFEKAFAEYAGSQYAVAVSSGSAGLHMALMAAGIGPQEEVICTSLTHPGTTHCILYQKAVPIFTDISAETFNLDPDEIKYRLSERTKAIIVTHYGGLPCDMEPILELARQKNLVVIEDATRALGGEYSGKKLGTYGNMGVFSFSPVNGVTTGEGGMVVTDDEETYHWLAMFRNQGIITQKDKLTKFPGPWHLEVQDLGFNYRMTEMQAALGLSQLSKAKRFLERRENIASRYNAGFAGYRELIIPGYPVKGRPSWHMYPLKLRLDMLSCSRKEVYDSLVSENIGVDVKYLPVYLHPYYVWIGHPDVCTIVDSLCPRAEEAYRSIICLPIYPAMTDQDVDDVIEAVVKIISQYIK